MSLTLFLLQKQEFYIKISKLNESTQNINILFDFRHTGESLK